MIVGQMVSPGLPTVASLGLLWPWSRVGAEIGVQLPPRTLASLPTAWLCSEVWLLKILRVHSCRPCSGGLCSGLLGTAHEASYSKCFRGRKINVVPTGPQGPFAALAPQVVDPSLVGQRGSGHRALRVDCCKCSPWPPLAQTLEVSRD